MNDPLKLIGQVLDGKYLIQAFVSEGGFATVYRAQHALWKTPVAIKLFSGLSSAPAELRESLYQAFIQEGAFLSELCTETASIVQPRDVGAFTSESGQWLPYMALEWLDGQNLDQLLIQERSLRARPWLLQELIALLSQVAVALDIAHEKGIAHRDIKPSNLFLVAARARAEIGTIKVLDFGVAKLMSDATFSASLVQTGGHFTSYTPQYAAPEQFNRELGATGPWTDVYSLALVAVELLVGRSPNEGDDLAALASAATNPDRRPTPRAFGVPVSAEVEAVFARALALSPRDRYHRAGQFWFELELASGLPMTFATRERAARGSLTPMPARPPTRGSTQPYALSSAPLPAPRAGRWKTSLIALTTVLVAAAALVVTLRRRASTDESTPKTTPAAAAAPLPSNEAVAPPPPAECPADSVKIPAGQFFMGSELKDAPDNEKPSHNVTLAAFCMDLHEVSAGAYKACSDVGKCKRAPKEVDWPKISDAERKLYSPLCNFDAPDRQDHPINCVTWEMADNFCTVNGKRLPTEAEWEFAARGPDGRVYPWGDEAPSAAHLNACGSECKKWGKQHDTELTALYAEDDGYVATAPVGSFPKGRSRFGPFDVVGNVWEWTSSWYGPYSAEKASNPRGPEKGERRVIRGGAFNGGYASWLHPSFRYGQVPGAQSHGIGFRCAASIAGAP